MNGPAISDHALLRFLERSGELDVEALRASLSVSLARAHAAARAIGVEEYRVTVGQSTFVFRGDVCVTVLEEHMRWPGQHPPEK